MNTVKEIYNFLNTICPFDTAMEFDNVGLLVGDFNNTVNKILIALDVTDEVVLEAKQIGANLIISHHPIIFKPINKIYSSDTVYQVIKNNINVICSHTNLDMATNGVNTTLAELLKLKNVEPLSIYSVNNQELPLGLIGKLNNPLSSIEFANFVKHTLKCDGLRFTNISDDKYISKVGVCSGSGGNLITEAFKNKVNAFLTGEIKHHEILFAVKNNITVVDVGHFKSENVIVEKLYNILTYKFNNIEIYKSNDCSDKIKYI